MRLLVATLATLLLWCGPSFGLTANQQAVLLAPRPYIGPGDLFPGATGWYGLRAYSLAVALAGNTKAISLNNGSTTRDIYILKNGSLDILTAWQFCGFGVGACLITQWYDQTGHGNTLTQATGADQYTLTFNCLNGLPCATSPATAVGGYSATVSSVTIATFSIIAQATAHAAAQLLIKAGPGGLPQLYFDTNPQMNCNASQGSTLSANTWYKMSCYSSSTTAFMNLDGTANSAANINVGAATVFDLGWDGSGQSLIGKILEGGFWTQAATTVDQSNLCHNQYAYWKAGAASC